MPRCCCHISDSGVTPDQCSSAQDKFQEWSSRVNHCTGTPTSTTLENGIVCTSMNNCVANSTFCEHATGAHFNRPSFKKGFPMTGAVADFFARHACSINDGSWNPQERQCSCPNNPTNNNYQAKGTYCLVRGDDNDPSLWKEQQTAGSITYDQEGQAGVLMTERVLLLCTSGAVLVAWLFVKHYRARQRYTGLKKVSTTVELRAM
jgi:hypothetical protein